MEKSSECIIEKTPSCANCKHILNMRVRRNKQRETFCH